MSLATNIKDFADLLHNIYAQQLSSLDSTDIMSDGVFDLAIPKIVVLQQACLYGVKSFISGVFYLLSFQWLRDFCYLPLISPEIGNESLTNHDTFLSEPFSYLFSFAKNGVSLLPSAQNEAGKEGASPLAMASASSLEIAIQQDLYAKQGFSTVFNHFFKSDQLFAGFVNSFFFSFPFSLPHLITLRRMFSQGIAAAIASIMGTVAAHSLFILGVLYGIRFLIIPYYSLQPATFLIGVVTIAIVITEFVKEKRVYLVPLTHYPSLFRIGMLNFVLALCESATVFHDLHHLTLNQQITYLQLYESQNAFSSFLMHTGYLIAFVLGHAFFSLGFCYLLLRLTEKVCSLTGWTLPQTARRINQGLLVAILTLTFSCFPYYGLDYLFTKSAGFLPEDPAYRNTIFSPTQVRSRNRHFKSRAPVTKNSKTPLELDLNYFDRGMYLNAPKEEKITSDSDLGGVSTSVEAVATYDPVLTFEELNYQGESAWLMRHERARRLPEEQDSKKESVFQKPKTHFKQLRVQQDNKQAEAALRESSQIGSISEWKEGIRPGENVFLSDKNSSTGLSGRTQLGNPLTNRLGNPMGQSPFTEGDRNADYQTPLARSLDKNRGKDLQEERYDKRLFLKDLALEKEIASNYEKSFASPFGEDSDGTPPDLLPVENIIKKRYRLNPVYRALLQTDVDLFIARQPANYKITQNQEASLFKKRQLLEKYYNSIRYYSPVESVGFMKQANVNRTKVVNTVIPGKSIASHDANDNAISVKDERMPPRHIVSPKSFIETVYHQQFKGTLNTVKRFFKLTFDEQQNPNQNRVLSYDQPLYKKGTFSSSLKGGESKDNTFNERYHPSLHEELDLEKISPFLEESNSAPIYAGWDDKARRFVITNRFNFVE